MSFSETIFLFFLALVIFGPKKLPEIARQIGKVLNEFRRASNEFKAQIEQEISHLEVEERRKQTLPASPTPEGTASRSLNAASSETSAMETSAEPASAEPNTSAATLAASVEDPVTETHTVPLATEAIPVSDSHASDITDNQPVTTPATQESHA